MIKNCFNINYQYTAKHSLNNLFYISFEKSSKPKPLYSKTYTD